MANKIVKIDDAQECDVCDGYGCLDIPYTRDVATCGKCGGEGIIQGNMYSRWRREPKPLVYIIGGSRHSIEEINSRYNSDEYEIFWPLRDLPQTLSFENHKEMTKKMKVAKILAVFVTERTDTILFELGIAHAIGKKPNVVIFETFSEDMRPLQYFLNKWKDEVIF